MWCSRRTEDEAPALPGSRAKEQVPGFLIAFILVAFHIWRQGDGGVLPADDGIGNDVPEIVGDDVDGEIVEAVGGGEAGGGSGHDRGLGREVVSVHDGDELATGEKALYLSRRV